MTPLDLSPLLVLLIVVLASARLWRLQHEELLFACDEWESWRRSAHINFQRAERAEAALARARELCDGPNDCKSCSAYSNIRAALEGGAE